MPQQNNNTLFILLAAGAAFYFFNKNKTGSMQDIANEAAGAAPPGSAEFVEQTDAVIDTTKQKLSLPDALNMAKDIAGQLKDAKIVIKRPGKGKNIAIRKGRKKVSATGKRKVKSISSKKTRVKLKKQFSAKNTARLFAM